MKAPATGTSEATATHPVRRASSFRAAAPVRVLGKPRGGVGGVIGTHASVSPYHGTRRRMTKPGNIRTTWTLATPPGAGAVAIVQRRGDIDGALAACGIAGVSVGEVRLRDLVGVDRGIVARFVPGMCQLMPHGGVAVVRALLAELAGRGIAEEPAGTGLLMY